jgi:hypothetical protein
MIDGYLLLKMLLTPMCSQSSAHQTSSSLDLGTHSPTYGACKCKGMHGVWERLGDTGVIHCESCKRFTGFRV